MAMKWDAVLKSAKNEMARAVADGVLVGDVDEWLDTGCYTLNALISGSLYGGIPEGKVTAFAAPSATGKTFIALQTVKQFLEKYENSACFYFESEGAVTKRMIEERGIDSRRIFIVPVATVQEFRTQAMRILKSYEETSKKDGSEKARMMFVLDSLGNLATDKSVEDAESGNTARDMTKAQQLKTTFTVLTMPLSKLKVPMLVTNHVYSTMDMYNPMEMAGGSGLKYVGSTIVYFFKRKLKDSSSGALLGNDLRCKAVKSRFTRENSEVALALRYESGLDRYYGLLNLALMTGVFHKDGNRTALPNGKRVFGTTIEKNPEEYFTPEVLDMIEKELPKILSYEYDPDESLPTLDETIELANVKELNEVEE